MNGDGIVQLDSPLAVELGFTSDLFDGWLWRKGDTITVSFIESKQPGQGHFSALLKSIWAKGWAVAVPTPLGRMRAILEAKGFVPTYVYDETFDDACELWIAPPPEAECAGGTTNDADDWRKVEVAHGGGDQCI